jgi:hypothetical protein
MSKQYEAMGEKAKKIETALKFTDGDMEKAKLMASGKLQDVVVIKGKFVDPQKNISGILLAFVNIADEYISAIRSVQSSTTGVYTVIRIFDDWKLLHNNLMAYESGPDAIDSNKLNQDLLESFIKTDIFPDVQSMNLDYLSVSIQDMIKTSLGSEKIKSQIELDKTSSMDVALAGIDVMVPSVEEEEEEEKAEDKPPEKKAPQTALEKKLDEIESNASFIVEGKCVLSPVKGKYINEIASGEKIHVLLPGKDELSEKIIDAYKARDHEGKPLPVAGKVVEKVYVEGGGVILYVLVAKGIYAKIVEEDNVKIQTEITQSRKTEKKTEKEEVNNNKIMNVFIYIIFALMIAGLIVIIVML